MRVTHSSYVWEFFYRWRRVKIITVLKSSFIFSLRWLITFPRCCLLPGETCVQRNREREVTPLSPWAQTKLRDGTWVLKGGISDPAEMKWCQPLSYHMAEFNLCDPHVLKPVEQSKVAADGAQGRPRGLSWTAGAYNETEGFFFVCRGKTIVFKWAVYTSVRWQ